MNAAPPIVVPILATPLGIVPLPEAAALSPALGSLFAARMAGDSSPQANPLCYRSRDDLLDLPEEPVPQLAAAIFRGVYSVVEMVNEFTVAQLREFKLEARGWFTIVKPDGCVPAASYPLTAWCAIYCVAAPPSGDRSDGGVLRLYETRLGTMFQDTTNSVMRMPYKPSHCSWRPVPGSMAVFPASLTHEIALLRSIGELILVTVRIRFVAPGQEGMPRW